MIYIIFILFLLFCLGVSYPLIYHKWLVKKDLTSLRELVDTRQYASAQKLVDKMLNANKRNIRVLFEQARIHQAQKQWYLALYSLEEIIKVNDYSASDEGLKEPLTEVFIRNNKIEIFKTLKKYDAVDLECEKILALDPNNMMAKFFMGRRLFKLKNYKLAKEYLQVADNEGFEKHREVLGMLVDIYLAEKKYIKAQSMLNKLFSVWDKPNCQTYHQKVVVLFYLKQYKESLEALYEIDKLYKWPLDLKLIEVISLYESYVQGDYLLKELSRDISNEMRWRDVEKVLMKKFEPLLSKHIDEEKDLVNHARYAYSVLLIKSGSWDLGIVQMKLIERVDTSYLDNSARLTMYENVKHDPVLMRFFQQKFSRKKEFLKLGSLIEKIVLNDSKRVCHDVQVSTCNKPLDPAMYLFHFKHEQRKSNLYAVFSLEQNLTANHLVDLIKPISLTQGEGNDLAVLSPFPLESMILQTKEFDDVRLYHGEELLKILQSFSDQIEALLIGA